MYPKLNTAPQRQAQLKIMRALENISAQINPFYA